MEPLGTGSSVLLLSKLLSPNHTAVSGRSQDSVLGDGLRSPSSSSAWEPVLGQGQRGASKPTRGQDLGMHGYPGELLLHKGCVGVLGEDGSVGHHSTLCLAEDSGHCLYRAARTAQGVKKGRDRCGKTKKFFLTQT